MSSNSLCNRIRPIPNSLILFVSTLIVILPSQHISGSFQASLVEPCFCVLLVRLNSPDIKRKFNVRSTPNSNSILERTDISERVLAPPWCSMGKQITIHSYKRLSIGSSYREVQKNEGLRNRESTVSKSHRDMSVAVSCIL